MHKLPVGVLGASGYAGRELCALVARHPRLELAFATANDRRGERATIAGREVTFVATEDAPLARAELLFSALPHGVSAPWVEAAAGAGARAVDLSADLRPGREGHAVSSGARVPYGLTEMARADVAGAQIVANPGCYATAVLLALLPVLERRLVDGTRTITVAAASGVTGAGFTPRRELMFAEVAEDFRAYAPGNGHRHLGEMLAVIRATGCDADLVFTPHLLPIARGILATLIVPLAEPLPDALAPWREHYRGEPFIEVTPEPPSVRDVVRRNVLRVSATAALNVRRPALVVTAALDNLMKGAAGQALQNGNLLLGLGETAGLPA
ncbi:MAG TPA: N-acetyl-gamma-glutamyl-phosphate reductase [Gemmatimonadaceae bacterium]|nr:N-acetyl-gamma-glutamyl-phosphate reductase [Gemmatimonadaceae bacterium]